MEHTEETKTETQLTVLDEFKILEVYKYDVIERAAEAIEAEVMSHVVDITEKKGRDREASLAYKVSQAKSRVVKLANESIQDAKATVKAVTSERLRLEARFDGIRDKRKAASVEWDKVEQARKDGHRAFIEDIRKLGENLQDTDIGSVEWGIGQIKKLDLSSLEEFAEECDIVLGSSLGFLLQRKKEIEEKATADAELARLQQKEADDKARIQKLEEDAASAKQKLIDDAAELKRKEDKIAADKQAVIDAAKSAEEQKKRDEDLAKQREDEALKRIEQAKIDAVKAEQEKQAEASRIKQMLEAQVESKRVAEENAELKQKAEKNHMRKVRQSLVDELSDHFQWEGTQVLAFIEKVETGGIKELTLNF